MNKSKVWLLSGLIIGALAMSVSASLVTVALATSDSKEIEAVVPYFVYLEQATARYGVFLRDHNVHTVTVKELDVAGMYRREFTDPRDTSKTVGYVARLKTILPFRLVIDRNGVILLVTESQSQNELLVIPELEQHVLIHLEQVMLAMSRLDREISVGTTKPLSNELVW
jgi:hypothetical protein